MMNRQQVRREIEDTLGVFPSIFQTLPDTSLELEWNLFKQTQLDAGAIPHKYRELIGLGISAATKCKYCIFFHTEMAKLHGATNAEIEEAVHFAKCSTGWSTYVSGLQTDFDQFKQDVQQICEHVRSAQFSKV